MRFTSELYEQFLARGWVRFAFDAQLNRWRIHALQAARNIIRDVANQRWFRYQNTWFAGVDVMHNDELGRIGQSGRLAGHAMDFIYQQVARRGFSWDRAQLSVCYPGYPQPGEHESAAAFRYRRDYAAAHLDGLLPVGAARRRFLREYHRFILGVPLNEFNADASPLMVWEGSHHRIRETFRNAFDSVVPQRWGDEDVTDLYQAVRRRIFRECERVTVHARPGECYLLHRHCLHGMAAWGADACCDADGRMICYFRPHYAVIAKWLHAP